MTLQRQATRGMTRTRRTTRWSAAALGAVLSLASVTALAAPAPCRTSGSFEKWLEVFKQEALAQGISRSAIQAAAPYLTYDARIVGIDRGQRIFAMSFLQFSDKLVPKYRIDNGLLQIKKHAATFARVEQQYGVPAPVIVAFWGLESDFGVNMGKDHSIRSIVSLAYDCRRADVFRGHLFDALRIIERGDLKPDEMIGSWAGELGQTQMMPSEYFKNAVDFDGDGHRNLLKSVPDVIASTAKYLDELGWKRGEPWLDEVRVPANLSWDQSDLAIQHPRTKWAGWGVTRADGKPLANDNLPASLVLPMGRHGPAFLTYNNFQAYLKWNNSLVYSTTAAFYAARLGGAGPMRRGSPDIAQLSFEQTKELQQILAKKGHDIGRVDGLLGAQSRVAVKKEQMKLGQPADSWPTPELLERLRR